ncbi:PREDICTED: histone-lysine N-methyltransferase SETMAR-like [Habropoda laboriosa]|uniref:histone-lysine N-methyltransferase SETMAR-like n=1 Tax=Habropoda laboriosa TaxID=597456 RepID=UPI00083D75B0|nr:PREDICTED: histone-lysine N-methyltransferase SETMAR-like [Habropoda laboriosa]
MTTTDSESPWTSETYLCGYPECGKSFKTIRGKSVHEQRTHKSWYDERQVTNIVNKKSPWSSEEQALLARQVSHLVLQNTKFINQALQPIFPHRTLESIKGQRRNKSHKDKVLQVMRELTADNSVTTGERTPSPPPNNILGCSENAPRSGRPVEADKDAIKALVDANRRITTREIGERLNLSNSTVYGHLKGMGLTSKLDVWVPHVLTERNLCRRVDACDSLLKRQENDPFLKRIITGDEKWVVYNNVKRKRSWSRKDEPAQSVSKANIHQKKVMLSVWWDVKGIVFFELLPDNTTINSEVYCHQLDKLNDSLKEKRPELINRKGVVFHQDNARPHTSLVTRQKLLQLEWDVLQHPPYSPDLAPSDYYLFRSLQNFLDGKTFTSNEDVKNHLNQFFASKDQNFYERGIMLLPERWQKVLDQNGQYII